MTGLVASCTDRPGGADEGAASVTVPPTSVEPPAVQCRERPAGAVLTVFDSGECTAALLAEDQGLALYDLGPTAESVPARGPAPEVCARRSCSFFGFQSTVGPVVVVQMAGPRSEMPAGVWLGVALDEARQQLVFFDLWAGAGQSVVGDGTDLGPTHALAPFACGDALGLFARSRTAAGEGVEAAATLVGREGVYAWDATAPVRADTDRSACTPIAIEMP